MKKILLMLIYPFWWFASKTWVGGSLVIMSVFLGPLFITSLIFPSIMNAKDYDGRSGFEFGMLSVMVGVILLMPVLGIDNRLRIYYTNLKRVELKKRTDECDQCDTMANYEDPDKWDGVTKCPKCGKDTEILKQEWN